MSRRSRSTIVVALLIAALGANMVGSVPRPSATESRVDVDAGVRAAAHQGLRTRVLVELRLRGGRHVSEGMLRTEAAAGVQRGDITDAQREVRRRLARRAHRIVRTYETVPYLALEIGPDGLAELEAAGLHVRRVVEDAEHEPTLAEGGPLVQAPLAWTHHRDGTGIVVAILDTGVADAHPFLSGKVVEQA